MPVDLPPLDIVRRIRDAFTRDAATAIDVVGPWGSAKDVIALQSAFALKRSLLLITAGRVEAENAHEDLCSFAGEEHCALFPAWEVLPSDAMAPSDDIVAERMNTLKRLTAAFEKGEPMYVVAPVDSLLQYVVDQGRLREQILDISVAEEYDLEELVERLVKMGYVRELMVENRGEISVRGGILDIFPISSELPHRIEFFGDEVESIRRFEPETQRSIGNVDSVQVLPRSEKNLISRHATLPGGLVPITAYFPKETLVVLDEPLSIAREAFALQGQYGDSSYFMRWDDATGHLACFTRMSLSQITHDKQPGAVRVEDAFNAISGWSGNISGFWKQLYEWNIAEFSVLLLCNNAGERRRLLELLEEQGYVLGRGSFDLRVEIGRLHSGFVAQTDRIAILSEKEIFGRHYVRRTRRRFEAGLNISSFDELRAGDYVVHTVHGIGRYSGLRRFSGKSGDFLAIQYSSGDMLYVPVTNIDMVQKFVGGEGAVPKVDRLGGATWARTKSRVKKAIRDMTEELVKLYAERETQKGYAFSQDTSWQHEFEDAFEYEETPDQARAIDEVKRDMESTKIMDRLICGDVGFGKTEVALRAAFKAVMDAKQVALLVPTTVLAQQHYTTFSERFADYPIRVEMLSRFRTPAEQRQTIERVNAGKVDVVIGTHRITSKDLQFKNLGLVIIDEEHRFGVAQKEKLKQLRTHVDVLTLTATPIPRTLNLSLTGIRDMSVINTAPNDRLPVHTSIEPYDDALIQEAVLREMRREGQVFYLHNRIQTIMSVADRVRKLVPGARIGVGHGQMLEHELEKVMSAFIRKEIDVLICTTIIGAGIDIPNANTIIIDRADRFGLADLYQLRGRVGRYKHRAFAYLLIPGDRVPTEDAQKRLKALEEFSSLGGGFRIAMRDLEIRGCGDILGSQQHGHILSVGYETYTQMIREAVLEIKGEPVARRTLPPCDIAVDAYIPEAYVPSEIQKMTIYKRIAGVLRVEDARDLSEELADRFGNPPAPVRRLLDVMRARALGADAGAKAISGGKDGIRIEFETSHQLGKKARGMLMETFGHRLSFEWRDAPALAFALNSGDDPIKTVEKILSTILEN
jgi:transcription-repair coupling factor (superfamily II helicase)